ncbi:MAG: TMEM43 family protein [Thermoguttaceae bacterium]|nr:TMEM43 family protein [Thermoguttaceae bacterium]
MTGLVLIVVSIALLFWNEGRTLHRYQDLKGAAEDCVAVQTSPVDPSNNAKPVYMTGEMKTDEILSDPLFPAVSQNAIKLQRTVEMYQWIEKQSTKKQKKLGGGEEEVTTYTYTKDWAEEQIDSSSFKEAGHDNPAMMMKSEGFTAQTASIGDFDAAALISLKNDTQQFIVKTAEEKAKEAAAAEAAPADAAPADAAPAEAAPAETTAPAKEAAATESTATAGTEEAETAEVKAEEPAVEEAKADNSIIEEVKAEEPAAEEAKSDEPVIEDVKAEEPAAEEAKAEEPAAEEAKAEEPAAEEAKAEEPAAEEAKLDAPAAEEAKTEEVKDENKIQDPPEGFQYFNKGYYSGKNPSLPEIGDLRVSFEYVPNGTVSVIAGQQDNKLVPWQSKNGTVILLKSGTVSQEQMFADAQKANKTMGWILRAIGLFVMYMGFNMIFKPLSVLADVVPLFGNLVGGATGIVSFLLALSISCLTIGIAWIYYRPWIGIPLVLAAIVLFVWAFKFGKKKA